MAISRKRFVRMMSVLPAFLFRTFRFFPALAEPFRRVRPGDAAWPSPTEWESLNQNVGGRLVALQSLFNPTDESTADDLFHKVKNPFFNSDHPELTQTLGWADAWRSEPSVFAVVAESTADVVAAVLFASKHRLRLVVKGTGHSYLGTSNARDSLLVWTHRMQKVEVQDNFTAKGCSNSSPQQAVDLGAGVYWLQAYQEVTGKRARYVQGGGCTTVGVAGFIQGGGFGSFSKYYGLGAAGLLEAEVVTADGRVLHANACQHPDLFWALKGGGGGTFGIVTKLTLRTRELPETFGVVYGEIQALTDRAYRILIGKLIDQYAENLFNENWGEQMIFNPSRKVNITMLFHGLSQDVAQNAWSLFQQWVVDNPADYHFITPLTVLVLPARSFWNANFLEQHAPGLIALDIRPGSDHEKFFYANNRGECGQFLHGYDSAWLPRQLLEKTERHRLADALYASSMIWTTGIHFNKGLAGSRPEEIAAARDCAMNPAVIDAFALAIIAGGGDPVYTGVSGHEPDLKEASSAASKIRQAMTTLRAGIPTTGSYLNESDYFDDNWRQSYWGKNYNRLAAVKKQYDPEGLFFVHHGVGSEFWSKDGFERIN
jgi:FAD/FMN-containing dehydrogenase